MGLERIIQAAAFATVLSSVSAVSAQELPIGYISKVEPAARLAVLGFNLLGNTFLCAAVAAAEERPILTDGANCLAGATIQFAGMEIGMLNVPVLPGIGLRVVETGTSIIDNTLAGRKSFEKLHYEFGPLLFEIDTNGSFNWYGRILPLAGLIGNITAGNAFNVEDTFSYQTFSFNTSMQDIDGYAFGNIMTYNLKGTYIRAHEFNHVLQYVRFRPAEQLVPSFLRDKAHLRIGEDLAIGVMNLPLLICSATGEKDCGRRWWNITEVESYVLETGNPEYQLDQSYKDLNKR